MYVAAITIILTFTLPQSQASAVQSVVAAATGRISSCERARTSSIENWHESRDNQDVRWRAHWTGNGCSVDLHATGDVKFNSDFTDVVAISNGGTFDLVADENGTTRRLFIKSDNGRLTRTYSVNGRDQAWSDDAARWFAGVLTDLDRVSGAGVDYRFPGLLARGGPRAVLDETEKMSTDYARGVYLRRLIDTQRLSDGDYQRAVNIAARDMTSDYERSRVLQTIFTTSKVTHAVAEGAVRAAGSFSSDYERSRVLMAALESKALDKSDLIPVIETVGKSTSDYEKSRVLQAIAARFTLDGDARKAYLRAADGIKSDYENRRVLSALMRQQE